jgi:hypothetical protein
VEPVVSERRRGSRPGDCERGFSLIVGCSPYITPGIAEKIRSNPTAMWIFQSLLCIFYCL